MLVLLGTSFLSGILTVLSPCVLPLIPILLLSALQQHPLGPLGLVAGLSVTFTTFGMMLAITGGIFGADPETLRLIFAVVMLILGTILLSEQLHQRVISLATPLTNRLQAATHNMGLTGVGGQFILGILLGGAWLPCTGPTLGLAASLAGQGEHLGEAASIMLFYCLGVSTPLIGISYLTREVLITHKRWLKVGKLGKMMLGLALISVGGLLLTGLDVVVEAWLLNLAPDWLLDLTTKY